jgi:hypothetical protein
MFGLLGLRRGPVTPEAGKHQEHADQRRGSRKTNGHSDPSFLFLWVDANTFVLGGDYPTER